jgi:hypothetical protein
MLWISHFEPQFDELWHLELSTGRGTAHATLPMNELIDPSPALTSLRGAPSIVRVPASLDGVTHPPAFPLLLRIWRSVFGESIGAARGLSAMLSALSVLALFEAARQLNGTRIALWAALILAVSSAQIESAQEVRNYPLATLITLVTAGVLARVERSGVTRTLAALLAGVTALTCLSHYFVAPVLAVIGIYALVRLRGRDRVHTLLALILGVALFAAVWGSMLARQRQAFADAARPGALGEQSSDESRWDHVRRSLERAAGVPVKMLFESRRRMTFAPLLGATLFVLPWLLLRRRPDGLLWAMWTLAVVGWALALDLSRGTRHLDQLRHTILAGPAVCASLALLAGSRIAYAGFIPAVIAGACAVALGQTYLREQPRYSDIGRILDADPATAREPVVFYSDEPVTWWGQWLHLGASHHSRTFPRPVARLNRPADAKLLAELRRWPNVWLVSGPTDRQPRDILPGVEPAGEERSEPFLCRIQRLRWSSDNP